jgi:hypothetical protein
MGKQAERLAKNENRTMSELMREAFRRYQQPGPDVREYIRQIAPTPPALCRLYGKMPGRRAATS